MSARRPQSHYPPQDRYVEVLREVGQGELDDFAEHFDVHPVTARRQLDGLVAQGRARRMGGQGRGPLYLAVEPERA